MAGAPKSTPTFDPVGSVGQDKLGGGEAERGAEKREGQGKGNGSNRGVDPSPPAGASLLDDDRRVERHVTKTDSSPVSSESMYNNRPTHGG